MFSNESILVNMNDMYKRICLLIGIYFIFNIPLSAKSFIISDKNRIEDAPLLDGEFSELNFGGAYLLEVKWWEYTWNIRQSRCLGLICRM